MILRSWHLAPFNYYYSVGILVLAGSHYSTWSSNNSKMLMSTIVTRSLSLLVMETPGNTCCDVAATVASVVLTRWRPWVRNVLDSVFCKTFVIWEKNLNQLLNYCVFARKVLVNSAGFAIENENWNSVENSINTRKF